MSHLTVWLYHFMSETPDNMTLILKPRRCLQAIPLRLSLEQPGVGRTAIMASCSQKQVRYWAAPALNRRVSDRRP